LYWVDRFDESLTGSVTPRAKNDIMHGSDVARGDENSLDKTKWICCAMRKLDKVVTQKERTEIMAGCSHKFPQRKINAMKKELSESGNLNNLIKMMHKDSSWFGLSFYEYPEKKGNVIYVKKIPFDPTGFKKAKDKTGKRYHYCHCTLVKDLIRNPTEKISPTFCYCGAGWYKSLWEGILEKPVRVDLLESVLQGDDSCKFAIHLPHAQSSRRGSVKKTTSKPSRRSRKPS
jgi:hypothetical protein